MRILLALASSLAVAFAACSSDGTSNASDGGANGSSSGAVGGTTFNHDVAPIVEKSCIGCHSKGGIAPFPLTTFAETKPMIDVMIAETKARTMPPWGSRVGADCTPPAPFQHDPSLTDAEIATLEKWKADGLQEGDPKEARTLTVPPTGLANPSAELSANSPFSVSGDGDKFRCFVLDPKLTSMTFMSGFNVIPGSTQVVHHALMFADPKGKSVALGGAEGSYDCFGGPKLDDTSLLGAWAPGTQAAEYAPGAAAVLDAGSRLVLQVHYHPKPGATIPDQTKVQLRYSTTPPTYVAITSLVGNFRSDAKGHELVKQPDETTSQFLIPAGAANHVEEMLYTVPAALGEARLASVGGHEHLLGKEIRISAISGGAEQCLLHIPSWDFNWQRAYAYDKDIENLPLVKGGDQLRVKCTYNNTLDNKALAAELKVQNASLKDVGLGEETLDEMCLAFMTVYKKL